MKECPYPWPGSQGCGTPRYGHSDEDSEKVIAFRDLSYPASLDSKKAPRIAGELRFLRKAVLALKQRGVVRLGRFGLVFIGLKSFVE